MNTLETIETRLTKKTAGLIADEKKIENLSAQITQYRNSIERTESGLAQKRAEVAQLTELKKEAEELTEKDEVLGKEMDAIRAYFEKFEWRPDQPYEEKLDSSADYRIKLAEREKIQARFAEIEKIANKTYYRR